MQENAIEQLSAAEAESARVIDIRQRVGAARLPAGLTETLSAELIRGGATVELAAARIFQEMARQSAAQPDQRSGLAVQRGDPSGEIENLARDIASREGISKESAVVRLLDKNPRLYDQYLAANPHQTGRR
jgi:hypothetical protein